MEKANGVIPVFWKYIRHIVDGGRTGERLEGRAVWLDKGTRGMYAVMNRATKRKDNGVPITRCYGPYNLGWHEMFDLDNTVRQVKKNCRISDSHHAGLYSVCGLALRLRDLYKWEKGLDPWVEEDPGTILEWIGRKEEEWDGLAEAELGKITISGREYDPLDVDGINLALGPHGYYYGAGYAHSLKPTFFLAVLEAKQDIEGRTVFLLGRELARDLLTIPALAQNGQVIIRKAAAKFFFWDQIFYVRKSARPALRFALREYGIGEDLKVLRLHMGSILEKEIDRYIYHELGEMNDRIFDRDIWRQIISRFPHTPVELLARCIKDFLADANEHGTLPHILNHRKAGMLGFYTAFMGGLAKNIFPEINEAFELFMASNAWGAVENAVTRAARTAQGYAGRMCTIFREGMERNDMEWTGREMEKALLKPLGLAKGLEGPAG